MLVATISTGKGSETFTNASRSGISFVDSDVLWNWSSRLRGIHLGAILSLVDYDKQGNPVRLHPGLGNLPLHPEKDGWYSVLGSWNGTSDNSDPGNPISEGNIGENHPIPVPARSAPRNPRSSLLRIFCQYHKCSGNSGPHTCAPGKFTCEAPNCTWSEPFKTKQAFNRHYRAMHLNDRVDCPVEGCVRVGAQGIKRADNLPAHMWNKHGISHIKLPAGN